MFPAENTVQPGGQSESGVALAQFKVKTHTGDFLVCRLYDSAASGSGSGDSGTFDVWVAKPYLLRRSPFSGQTRNGVTYTYDSASARSGTTGGTAQQEAITPSYQVDDIIYGFKNINGEADVTDCHWVDVNCDGRSWAKKT